MGTELLYETIHTLNEVDLVLEEADEATFDVVGQGIVTTNARVRTLLDLRSHHIVIAR